MQFLINQSLEDEEEESGDDDFSFPEEDSDRPNKRCLMERELSGISEQSKEDSQNSTDIKQEYNETHSLSKIEFREGSREQSKDSLQGVFGSYQKTYISPNVFSPVEKNPSHRYSPPHSDSSIKAFSNKDTEQKL